MAKEAATHLAPHAAAAPRAVEDELFDDPCQFDSQTIEGYRGQS